MTSPIQVLVITRKPEAPSFEQRFARFVEPMAERGIAMTTAVLGKTIADQKRTLARARDFHGVWWHRHLLSPRLGARHRQTDQPIIYDYDDAMPISATKGRPTWSRRLKFRAIVRRADVVVAASEYLADLARRHAQRIEVVPMAIDLPALPSRDDTGAVELLWLGSASTQPFLEAIRPALESIGRTHRDIRLRLVAHEPMNFGELDVDFRPWSPTEQDAALRECHVGLCPMPDTPFTRGKCPYKVIQYMAHGMAWIGSAVGENIRLADRDAGLVADDHSAWEQQLARLITDANHRQTLGRQGRELVEAEHGRHVIADRLAGLWRSLVESSSEHA